MDPIDGAAGRVGADACAPAKPGASVGGSGGATAVASGAATRTGASAELPASLRGGGLGLAIAVAATGGAGGLTTAGLDLAAGNAGGLAAAGNAAGGVGEAGLEETVLPSGALPAFLAAEALTTAGDRASSRLVWRCGALGDGVRFVEDAAAFGVGLRATDFAAGRLAEAAGLACALEAGLRLGGAAALPAPERALAVGRAVRLAAGLAAALGCGRATATLRVAVACFAGAATFFALEAGRRVDLLTALPAEGRFPDPLAGVDAFIRAISPSSTGRREHGKPSNCLRASPENLEPAIPWTAESEPA